MSRRSIQILVGAVLVLGVAVCLPQRAEARPPTKSGKSFVVKPAADMKWVALPDAPPGPMLSVISGDPMKGAYTAIEKFPGGFSAPMHTHPADHKAVIISGTWIHGEPGKPEVRLGPGSYLFQPAGQQHSTACDAASECVFFIESSGKFGIKVIGDMKPAK